MANADHAAAGACRRARKTITAFEKRSSTTCGSTLSNRSNPTGTRRTVLTFGEPSGADGLVACSSFDNLPTMIFGSGVGTDPFEFPEGVAVRLRAGQQLLLNLHLFNTSATELTGESGTRARLVDPASTVQEAESILAGTLSLSLPPQQATTTHGSCRLTQSGTIFGVQPHMHQLGTHMKVVVRTAARGDVLLHDADYDFGEQPDLLDRAAGAQRRRQHRSRLHPLQHDERHRRLG